METSLHVALSGQIASERRLATIADNIANINTIGFRQTGVRFSELIGGGGKQKLSFVSPGKSTLSDRQGALEPTGNQLDFAINGNGWFSVETSAGAALTKDGRMKIAPDGTLTNLEGFPVLDQAGTPIQLVSHTDPIILDGSGVIHQRGVIVGSIGVFEVGPIDETLRVGALSFQQSGARANVAETDSYSLQQGFVEKSNVDPIAQISKLISVQRNFEQSSNLMQKNESLIEEAIRLLGGK